MADGCILPYIVIDANRSYFTDSVIDSFKLIIMYIHSGIYGKVQCKLNRFDEGILFNTCNLMCVLTSIVCISSLSMDRWLLYIMENKQQLTTYCKIIA